MKKLPLICTKAIEIPVLLQIQMMQPKRICILEEKESPRSEVIYLPCFVNGEA